MTTQVPLCLPLGLKKKKKTEEQCFGGRAPIYIGRGGEKCGFSAISYSVIPSLGMGGLNHHPGYSQSIFIT